MSHAPFSTLGHSPSRRLDVIIALLIFLTAASTGFLYCRLYTGVPWYYQRWFGPAVMLASGHGYTNPDTAAAPSIKAFLDGKRDRLDRTEVPADTPRIPLEPFQKNHRYLLFCVGLWWRLAGVAWPQVAVVSAILYGLTIVSLYAIFRLAVRRTFAVLGALWLCFSAMQLENLPHLRDYSKAPFILAALSIAFTVALRAVPRPRLLALSALGGAILGIGTGFRPDVTATGVPIFALALLFHGRRPWHHLRDKLVAVAVFLLGFGVWATPILVNWSNSSHVTLLGLTEPFDAALGINSPVYNFGHYYNDTYAHSVAGSYGERIHGAHFDTPAFEPAPGLDRMERKYLVTLGRQFPADMWARVLASMVGILESPFGPQPGYKLPPYIPFQGAAAAMYGLTAWFAGLGVPLAVLLLVGMAIRRLEDAVFAALVLLFLLGLPALQFDPRHYFHLQFVSLLSLLLLLDSLLSAASRMRPRWRTMSGMPSRSILAAVLRQVAMSSTNGRAARAAGRGVLVGLLIVGTTILPLGLLRRLQERDLRRLFGDYTSAEKQEVHPIVRAAQGGRELLTWDGAAGRAFGSGQYRADYYVMDVTSDAELAIGTIEVKYLRISPQESPTFDLSRTMTLTFTRGSNRIFFPVYSSAGFREFAGLEIGHGLRDRLRGVFRVMPLDRMPLLLDLRLGPDWPHERLFQTLRFWERPNPSGPTVYASLPATFSSGRGWIDLSPSAARLTEGLAVKWSDPRMVKAEGRRLLVNGRPKGRFAYLVQFEKREIPAGASLVARGRVEHGGLTVGLLKDDAWYKQVTIDQPGDFAAVLVVEQTGTFVPMIANAIPRALARRNRVVIGEIGILDSNAVP